MGYLAEEEISADKGYCSKAEYKEANWVHDYKPPYPQL